MSDRSSTADYIGELTLELAKLAGQARLPVLAYLLDMVALEAARVDAPAKARRGRPRAASGVPSRRRP
jgi:hypothetical protein